MILPQSIKSEACMSKQYSFCIRILKAVVVNKDLDHAVPKSSPETNFGLWSYFIWPTASYCSFVLQL